IRLAAVDGVPHLPPAEESAALRPVGRQAVIADAARRNCVHRHALPDGVSGNTLAELVYHAYGLVPYSKPLGHRKLAPYYMNVCAADGRERDFYHGLARTGLRNRFFHELVLVRTPKDVSSHHDRLPPVNDSSTATLLK